MRPAGDISRIGKAAILARITNTLSHPAVVERIIAVILNTSPRDNRHCQNSGIVQLRVKMFYRSDIGNSPRELRDEKIVFQLDLDGNFTFLNSVGERILGYSCEEVCRMNITEVVAPEFANYVRRQLTRRPRQRFGIVYEIDIVTKQGRRVALETSAHIALGVDKRKCIQGIAICTGSSEKAFGGRIRCLDTEFEFGLMR